MILECHHALTGMPTFVWPRKWDATVSEVYVLMMMLKLFNGFIVTLRTLYSMS